MIQRIVKTILRLPAYVCILIFKGYKVFISPFLPPSCRFYPTCSEYGMLAVKRFGFIKGLWLTVKRISRCHPFHKGGFDPVPEKMEWFKKKK